MMRWLFLLALLLPLAARAQTQTLQAIIHPIAPVATACCTLTTGGTAQNFQNATFAGGTGFATSQTPVACFISNPTTAAEQGIATAEAIWINVVTTAAAAAGATSIPLEAGQNITIFPSSNAISWIAATTSHKITGYCWQ